MNLTYQSLNKIEIVNSKEIKLWFFYFLLSLFFLILGLHFWGRLGLFLAFLFSICLSLFNLTFKYTNFFKILKYQKLFGQDPWGISNYIDETCSKLKMLKPEIYIYSSPSANSFNFFRTLRAPCIGLSTGALENLNQNELYTLINLSLLQLQTKNKFSHLILDRLNQILNLAITYIKALPLPQTFFNISLFPFIFIRDVLQLSSFNTTHVLKSDKKASQHINAELIAQTIWKIYHHNQCLSIDNFDGFDHHFTMPQKNKKLSSFPSFKKRIFSLIGYYPI